MRSIPSGLCVTAIALTILFLGASISPAHAQGVPGVDENKCLAGKTKCVSKKIAGLLKCRQLCQKKPDKCGQVQTDCEDKVMAKFDGGDQPEKGCFAKLEAKADPAKPESVCSTTGDTAAVEDAIDAMVVSLLALFDPPQCPPPGVTVAGSSACWYATGGLSCDATCAGPGLTCDAAEMFSFGGPAGTTEQCFALLEALSLGAGGVSLFNGAPDPVPCRIASTISTIRIRNTLSSQPVCGQSTISEAACACAP